MNSKQAQFVKSVIEINDRKTQSTLLDELKEMYRFTIKHGNRREFIEKAKSNNELLTEASVTEILSSSGVEMFAFIELFREYAEFTHWLERMTGETIVK